MLARFERRVFREGCKVWIAKYRGLHNIPHWHFENELIACSQGSATVNIDGDTYNIKNMCVYLPVRSFIILRVVRTVILLLLSMIMLYARAQQGFIPQHLYFMTIIMRTDV